MNTETQNTTAPATIRRVLNYRIYDRTGGGSTEDITASSQKDAIAQGRDWIEGGEWGGDHESDEDCIATCRRIELECEVGPIIYRPVQPETTAEIEQLTISSVQWCDAQWQVAVAAAHATAAITLLTAETGGAWTASPVDSDGDVWLAWAPPADVATEEDEEGTEAADRCDCSGTYSDPEPDCPVDEGWDFVGTDTAGLAEFGCRSHGGTGMTCYAVCRNTGIYRDTYDPGSQRNPGQPLEVTTYRVGDEWSEAYIVDHHESDDGYIPGWLATHLGRSISTRMTADQAREYVAAHTDDDAHDSDDLEHAFAALMDRRADDDDRAEGLWSHICQYCS